ncbi:hypothetical protein R3P38DRAFT_2782372 [Favolaschia claudopus]|uniref:Uncharacterized protein n=1 Tax=Favolaschia claudopus TaxID=2862362 RepID=A0AAW0B2F1_9AGAR
MVQYQHLGEWAVAKRGRYSYLSNNPTDSMIIKPKPTAEREDGAVAKAMEDVEFTNTRSEGLKAPETEKGKRPGDAGNDLCERSDEVDYRKVQDSKRPSDRNCLFGLFGFFTESKYSHGHKLKGHYNALYWV